MGTSMFGIFYTLWSLNSLSLSFASVAALNMSVAVVVQTDARNPRNQPFLLQDGNGIP